MSHAILIIGPSGSGKSTSLRNLNPEETFTINVLNKPFPFRKSNKFCNKVSQDGTTGNYSSCKDNDRIKRQLKVLSEKRHDIKNIVIDDFTYTMTNSFMEKALIKGYDKFSELGKEVYEVLECMGNLRSDLFVFILGHSDTDANGIEKCKTIGKILDEKVCVEGMFTYVFHAIVSDGKYKFLTQNNGKYLAKSPFGCFDDLMIDNDLNEIKNKIVSYYEEDIEV